MRENTELEKAALWFLIGFLVTPGILVLLIGAVLLIAIFF